MLLRSAGLSSCRRIDHPVAPTSGHNAYCRAIVVTFDIRARPGKASFSVVIHCSALALRVHSPLAARGQAFGSRDGLRSQPVRSARERKTRAAQFRRWWPVSAPRTFVPSLNRRAIMRSLDTLPGESNTSIISSIINAVCPQCGGRMSAFECEGRCGRNWLAEWEWANRATSSPKFRRGQR